MPKKTKAPSSRGELNIALNALVRRGTIVSYDIETAGERTTIGVTTEPGADQSVVVQQVREALPDDFADAQVRTVSA